ncbi:MAG: CoA-binding protein [Deltaproteobacteria bacterium HGW-Deltaproteobacteria-19]|jgi:acetyltransferase|nr:MAG: CoA-binding protein [Deltaproteobacteria bacterium HGW-Deltaproteobacteria-19]
MKKFLEPRSVALIGVPRASGPDSYNNAETMLRYGYEGRLFPINPNAGEIYGLKSYKSVLDLPEPADLAVISTGRDRVLPALKDCIRAGIDRVVVITQGFSDADEKGKAMQDEIVRTAREGGVRVLGPNTMGILNNFRNFTTAFMDTERPRVYPPVSVIAQTGFIQMAAPNMGYRHWGKAIDIGNGADVDVVDALEYLEDDPETKIIFIYMEGISRGPLFLETVAKITRRKPVLVFKSGRTRAGARAALSHTGSLVGEDAVFEAAFRRTGVIRVNDGSELTDAVHALLLLGEMAGPRIAVLTITGAGGIMVVDACEPLGLTLAELPEGLAKEMKQGIPGWIPIGNPLDIWPIGMIGGDYPGAFGRALTGFLKSPGVDGVMAILPATLSPLHQSMNLVEVCERSRRDAGNGKPVAMWVYIDVEPFLDRYEAIPGMACFPTIEQSVRALSFSRRWHEAKNRRIPAPRSFPVDRTALDPLLAKGRERGVLLGEDALAVLKAFGIPAVPGAIAAGRSELEALAPRFRYPVVLKLAGDAFLHKTEWNGVITGIGSPAELAAAYERLLENVRRRSPDTPVEAVQIQEQTPGLEILLGIKRDPQFGPVVACGLGGIHAEVFRDVSRALAPVDTEEAEEMLRSLKSAPLIEGTRGRPGIDRKAVIDVLERLSFLALDIPDIAELDINPLMASPEGCLAVDARIVWHGSR